MYSWRQRSPQWYWTAQWSQHRHHSQSSSSKQRDSVSNPRRHLHSWQNHEPGRLSACTEPAELYRQLDGAGPGESTCPHGGAPDGCFVDGGLDNVLIKADEEIPNVDGSALDFARLLDEAGTVDQDAEVTEAVICEKLSIGEEDPDQKYLYVEPYDGFEVTMRVNYPPPILEQQLTFNAEQDSFLNEIAPARSFNTFQNIDMAQKMGKVGSGYLNSHIIIYDGKVINTELRFTDEFVRHKILDLIGDLFLLGYPLRGRVVANMTSHGYNQALVQKMYSCFA